MYKIFICASLTAEQKTEFAKFFAELFRTLPSLEEEALSESNYTIDGDDVHFLELPAHKETIRTIELMMINSKLKAGAWMVLDMCTSKMVSARNVNDCAPGHPYTWTKFVDFCHRRLNVRHK